MTSLDKAFLGYIQLKSKNKNLDFRIETHHGRSYLMLYIDCAKMDRNTSEYDEEYYNFFVSKRPKNVEIWIVDEPGKYEHMIEKAEQDLGIKKNYHFSFAYKNYDYIDGIDDKINQILKDTEGTEFSFLSNGTAEFSADGRSAKLQVLFRNIGFKRDDEDMGYSSMRELLEFLLKKHNLTLESYSVAMTYGGK